MSYTNLLQKLAIALSDGKADAKVDYVPVSGTPYVVVTMDAGFAEADAVRDAVLMEVVARGFRPVNDRQLVKESKKDGFRILSVDVPRFDKVTGKAVFHLADEGSYEVRQDLDVRKRDREGDRRAFEAAQSQRENDLFWRRSGKEAAVQALLRHAPFKVEVSDQVKIVLSKDPDVHDRVVKAFAGQGLHDMDDLVRDADLADVLDRTTSPAP